MLMTSMNMFRCTSLKRAIETDAMCKGVQEIAPMAPLLKEPKLAAQKKDKDLLKLLSSLSTTLAISHNVHTRSLLRCP